MATNPSEAGSDRSVGHLLRDLTQSITDLIRNELQLARSELADKVDQVAAGLAMIAGGLMAATAALVVLLLALAHGLESYLPAWTAAALVGLVVAVLAFLLVRGGVAALSARHLAPDRTMNSLRDTAREVGSQMSSSPAFRERTR